MEHKETRDLRFCKNALNGLIIAGIIILGVSLYYRIIKAGIPYQDPTEELRLKYAINMGIGDELFKVGLITFAIGLIPRIALAIIGQRNSER
ncbi:MAG: hypothetical protein IKX87_12630 [Lachnospiraceae bacterium]|nr:hypothetical protein [Lachnospiraceae bacterium]